MFCFLPFSCKVNKATKKISQELRKLVYIASRASTLIALLAADAFTSNEIAIAVILRSSLPY
jgi:hypothetical protein